MRLNENHRIGRRSEKHADTGLPQTINGRSTAADHNRAAFGFKE